MWWTFAHFVINRWAKYLCTWNSDFENDILTLVLWLSRYFLLLLCMFIAHLMVYTLWYTWLRHTPVCSTEPLSVLFTHSHVSSRTTKMSRLIWLMVSRCLRTWRLRAISELARRGSEIVFTVCLCLSISQAHCEWVVTDYFYHVSCHV